MDILEEHTSPDGALKLIVGRTADGDICVGFDGYPWHTHADILASLSGLTQDDAVRQYVDDLINNRSVVGVSRIGGKVEDAWICDDPAEKDKHKPEDVVIELRYWSGNAWQESE